MLIIVIRVGRLFRLVLRVFVFTFMLVLSKLLIVAAFLRPLPGFVQRIAGKFQWRAVVFGNDRHESLVNPLKQLSVSAKRPGNAIRPNTHHKARALQRRHDGVPISTGPEFHQPPWRQAVIVAHRPFKQRIHIAVEFGENDIGPAHAHGHAGILNFDLGRSRLCIPAGRITQPAPDKIHKTAARCALHVEKFIDR